MNTRIYSILAAGVAAILFVCPASAQSYDYRYTNTKAADGGSAPAGPGQSCLTPWGATIDHGDSVLAYQAPSVPFGSSCSSESRVCDDGDLTGSFAEGSCVVGAGASCSSPWGSPVAHGAVVIAYGTPSVPFGSTCLSEERSCSNGDLSGTLTVETCEPEPQDQTPNALAVASQTGLGTNFQNQSPPLQVTGINGNVPISTVSPDSSFRVCADSGCLQVLSEYATSGVVRANDWIWLRSKTSSQLSTTTIASYQIGTFTLDWSMTTSSTYCGGVGGRCEDGSVYVGQNPHTLEHTFAAACDAGQTWDGSACVGTRIHTLTYGPSGDVPGIGLCTSGTTGDACWTGKLSSSILVAAGSYPTANYCAGLSLHGHDDWYVPALREFDLITAMRTSPNFLFNIVQPTTATTAPYASTSPVSATAYFARHVGTGTAGGLQKPTVYNSSIKLHVRCMRSQ